MKRIWFAVVFILIALALCISEQVFVTEVYGHLSTAVDSAQQYAERGDTENAEKEIQIIRNDWNRYNNLICALTNHNVPDELGSKIRSLSTTNQEYPSLLSDIDSLLYIYYEEQQISFANIL